MILQGKLIDFPIKISFHIHMNYKKTFFKYFANIKSRENELDEIDISFPQSNGKNMLNFSTNICVHFTFHFTQVIYLPPSWVLNSQCKH